MDRAFFGLMSVLLPISAVVPTKNRAGSLERMLQSLARQSAQPTEMVVIDASTDKVTENLCKNPVPGLKTKLFYHHASETGAAAQRNQAMPHVSQETIWFIDDDVIFEPECVARLWKALQSNPNLGGVNAMIVNQRYLPPGVVTRLLFQFLHGRSEESYAGKCIGPALNLLPEDRPDLPEVVPVEWLNTTCALYRRKALPQPPFLYRFTGYSMMEDVSLSLIVGRQWKLANARTARIFHNSQGGDHKDSVWTLSEMELVNRHFVMTQVLGNRRLADYFKLAVLELFHLVSQLRFLKEWSYLPARLWGKTKAVYKILNS